MNHLLGDNGMSFNFNDVEPWFNRIAEIGKGGSVFDLDHLFVPINVGNLHWIFLHVQPKKKTVKLYDSLGSNRNSYAHQQRRVKNKGYLAAMNRYLYMLISGGFDGGPVDMNAWTTGNNWTFSDASNSSPVQQSSIMGMIVGCSLLYQCTFYHRVMCSPISRTHNSSSPRLKLG